MEIVRTILEDNEENIIQKIENVLLPCNRGERIYVDNVEYNIWRIDLDIKNLENTTVIIKTLWVE